MSHQSKLIYSDNLTKRSSKMKKFLSIFQIIFGLFQLLPLHNAIECNSCSILNNLACVSATNFRVCANGSPTGPTNSCPAGYVCSTTDAVICKPNSQNVVVACSDCGKCDTTGTFACIDERSYLLCLGATVPSSIGGTCGADLVCSIDYQQICGSPQLGVAATCSSVEGSSTTSTTTSTTPDPSLISNPQYYCQQKQQTGRFPVGNAISATCKQFIYCFYSGGVWYGAIYVCAGSTYFDSASAQCVDRIPAGCV